MKHYPDFNTEERRSFNEGEDLGMNIIAEILMGENDMFKSVKEYKYIMTQSLRQFNETESKYFVIRGQLNAICKFEP